MIAEELEKDLILLQELVKNIQSTKDWVPGQRSDLISSKMFERVEDQKTGTHRMSDWVPGQRSDLISSKMFEGVDTN